MLPVQKYIWISPPAASLKHTQKDSYLQFLTRSETWTCLHCIQTHTCMFTLLPDLQLDSHNFMLSLAHRSAAVVMAAVGKAEKDFSRVIPKAEHRGNVNSQWKYQERWGGMDPKHYKRKTHMLVHQDPKLPGIKCKKLEYDWILFLVPCEKCFFPAFPSLLKLEGFFAVRHTI